MLGHLAWVHAHVNGIPSSVAVHAGTGKSVIATDVLWSDPAPQPGLVANEARGVGLLFGPDVTQVHLWQKELLCQHKNLLYAVHGSHVSSVVVLDQQWPCVLRVRHRYTRADCVKPALPGLLQDCPVPHSH